MARLPSRGSWSQCRRRRRHWLQALDQAVREYYEVGRDAEDWVRATGRQSLRANPAGSRGSHGGLDESGNG